MWVPMRINNALREYTLKHVSGDVIDVKVPEEIKEKGQVKSFIDGHVAAHDSIRALKSDHKSAEIIYIVVMTLQMLTVIALGVMLYLRR